MDERIVVYFRAGPPDKKAPTDPLRALRSIQSRASACGARLVAWAEDGVAVDFALEQLEDAIDLVVGDGARPGPPGSFGAGLAQGEVMVLQTSGSQLAIGWGPVLSRAGALARLSRPGEVLLDASLDAVRGGELLNLGGRIGSLGGERIRGVRLDLGHPWRRPLSESVARIARAPLIGRPEISEMLARAGTLAVVRADPGVGGTRFLEDLDSELAPARVVRVAPHPMGEPLGALRRALARSQAVAPRTLDGRLHASLDGLLGGEGLDTESAAALLTAIVAPDAPNGPSGAVVVDDAGDVDADTLDAVVHGAANAEAPFRVVARLEADSDLPAALAGLPPGPEIALRSLSRAQAGQLARALLGGELDIKAAMRWGKRGGGVPLAIAESVADGIEGGELVWDAGGARPRILTAGRGRTLPARRWIHRRLMHLDSGARAVLSALAVFGGEAEAGDLEQLVKRAADLPVDFERTCERLQALRWLARDRAGLVSLPSRTHRSVIFSVLSGPRLAEWHRAAATVLGADPRPLVSASAATFAMLGGDVSRAARLARRAAAAAHAAGMEATAAALAAFAESEDPGIMSRRGLSGSVFPAGSIVSGTHSIHPSALPPDGWAGPERPTRDSYPPLELPTGVRGATALGPIPSAPRLPTSEVFGLAEAASMLVATPEPPSVDVPGARREEPGTSSRPEKPESLLELDLQSAPPSDRAHSSAPPVVVAAVEEEAADDGGDAGAPGRAAAALRGGDAGEVERIVGELRDAGENTALADRLEAMALLARGDTARALNLLRAAAERARELGARERSRAALAHGVGLAAAGRAPEALLEALDGLARAREAGDTRGERACVRFIGQLTKSAGHDDIARGWERAIGS